MKKQATKLFKVVSWSFMIAGLVTVLIPFIKWFGNPELTQIELFLTYWKVYLSGFLFGIVALILYPWKAER